MRDLAFVLFLLAFVGLGFKRPFLFVLAYVYVDVVTPQRLTYWLLNSVPVSLIVFGLAFAGWLLFDDKRGTRFSARQGLLLLLLVYCGITTPGADFPITAWQKWDWVWKALVFAIFLPLTLRTKLRIEALLLVMILSASSMFVTGGIKTLVSGGGYGSLSLLSTDNSGLYEGSTASTVAVAIVPVILWLMKHGTVFPPDWRVRFYGFALILACLLIPVGTQARTGLVCLAVLAVLMLRQTRRRFLYVSLLVGGLAVAIPNLPDSYTQRMDTIGSYKADSSASTRIAVWKWTLDYVGEKPFGGGFSAYLGNELRIEKQAVEGVEGSTAIVRTVEHDEARAYHSAYFEMLGEQGWPGLFLWLAIHLSGLWSMERLRSRSKRVPELRWQADLAGALLSAQIIYLVGALFVGIAFQPFVFMLLGAQIGLATFAARAERDAPRPMRPGAVAV